VSAKEPNHAKSHPEESLGWLRGVLLLVWAFASFGLMFFAQDLQMHMGSWPFSFWLAAQGILLVFVLIVFIYAVLANRAESAAAQDALVLPLRVPR